MRGSKAKALRRQVYGEFSQREPSPYACYDWIKGPSGRKYPRGPLFCTGRRADYQRLKRAA